LSSFGSADYTVCACTFQDVVRSHREQCEPPGPGPSQVVITFYPFHIIKTYEPTPSQPLLLTGYSEPVKEQDMVMQADHWRSLRL